MYSIKLKPVYSCPADKMPQDINLPENWSLSWHQLETFKAINDPNIDVIFNIAMTGDGKSLGAYLDTLQGEKNEQFRYILALYPTNELARDQQAQINHYIDLFKPNNEPRINRLSGADLEIYAETEDIRKEEAIATKIENSEIIQTNPDILHYLRKGAYLMPKDRPDKLWSPLDNKFKFFVFDEFHIFNAPQITNIINTMLLVRHTNRDKKYLFLSATPETQIIERLQKVGFKCKVIDPYQEQKYQFPDTLEEYQELETKKWRKVVGEISLTFIPLESAYNASENWLKENKNIILSHFQKYQGCKGAIILNSIASVKRLTPLLQEFLSPLKVQENTSLTGKIDKEKSLDADLVIGTSTIDVGVDFKINFLIFESADAGSFIQRLGRLARHDSYEKEGKKINFDNFTAYALTPNFLVERLFNEQDKNLEENAIYDRPFFHEQIRNNYRKINNFEGYYQRWGGVLSVLLSGKSGLGHKTIEQQFAGSKEAFKKDCETVFNLNLKKTAFCMKKWGEEWQQLSGKKGNPILESASSFRGSSALQCGLYDLTEVNECDRFKTYNLPSILSNLDIEPITEAEFKRILEKTKANTNIPIPKGRFRHCLGFMKLNGYREERLNWKFTHGGDLKAIADSWKVTVLSGIQVYQPDNRWINEINKRLKIQGLVSYVVPYPMSGVKRRLQLPMHFEIYPIDEVARDEKPPYSIAFGQSALLLDTLAYRLKSKGGESWIC
ncbi:CRISPR-associated helicase Cas3 [Geminocystis sp. NIES-3708]|uniref:type I-D CRISPR-associated helicase Cas3' n=1 Tax=Geminocystis sp. NIES-3708 TaxID=1615909 RepID=UPI0005FCD7F7|nr:type I-D CRISPR-associated helicase Cas3' [Geminocystis sp. NIES-3708]BAQ61522.1 CRISPR-associated helicase Cas3 [Geminocystis sp. NIES-3708]